MDRIASELKRIRNRISIAHPLEQTALYAAQQALAWAENPESAMAPLDFISGTQAAREDCLAENRPPQL